jgi:hypothetical protein
MQGVGTPTVLAQGMPYAMAVMLFPTCLTCVENRGLVDAEAG